VSPYAELVALAERERDLIREGHFEEAAEVSSTRLQASLALGVPPADAREQLERLVALQAEITACLTAARAFTARKLGEMNRGRSAVRGYGAAMGSARSSVDGRA
jgi:hypothetical protein